MNDNEADYGITKKGEPEKGTAVSRKSIAAFIATIMEDPEQAKKENPEISKQFRHSQGGLKYFPHISKLLEIQ